MSLSAYRNCRLCPRGCGVDREKGERGFCLCGTSLVLACAGLHAGEEPPISGEYGSGTLFLSSCTLGCSICQNRQISQRSTPLGRTISVETGVELCLYLQSRGAETLNVVTGTQFIPSLTEVLSRAKARGLEIPVVWNSSGFESPAALNEIDPFIDIYLADIKTVDISTASRLFGSPSYPKAATEAVQWMIDNKPLRYREGKLTGGCIIRHLVIPGERMSTHNVIQWFSRYANYQALFSLMLQFLDPEGNLRLRESDAHKALALLENFGINEGFVQESGNDGAEWLPDFQRLNPFPQGYSVPLWHWKTGYCT